MGKYLDLTGKIFGRLTCLKYVGRTKGYQSLWLCRCNCGNEIIVHAGNLNNGHTQSCGCLQKERTSKTHTIHGLYYDDNRKRRKLGRVWSSMKQRCLNPNDNSYKDYGGRGITICETWLEFKPFYDWAICNGYQEGLTIERINVNGNYEPSNCKWATKQEQSRNKRSTCYISYNGITRDLKSWSEYLGIEYKVLQLRISRGWSIERSFNQSVRRSSIETNKTTA